jgi:hypothetical protein
VFVSVTSVVMSPLQTSNLQKLAQSSDTFLVHSSSAPCLPAAASVLQYLRLQLADMEQKKIQRIKHPNLSFIISLLNYLCPCQRAGDQPPPQHICHNVRYVFVSQNLSAFTVLRVFSNISICLFSISTRRA